MLFNYYISNCILELGALDKIISAWNRSSKERSSEWFPKADAPEQLFLQLQPQIFSLFEIR